jgi:arylsulfatase A
LVTSVDGDKTGERTQEDVNSKSTKPNIVYFFVDDMGYGDVSCLNPEGKIRTPNFDRLAREGMKFTDAHATSSVCSPSRYSLLTGRYNWRSWLQAYVCGGLLNPKPMIAKDRLTVPGFLKRHGYHTACIGKWHIGMGWDVRTDREGPFSPTNAAYFESLDERWADRKATEDERAQWKEVFSKPLKGGPTAVGFDSFFGVDLPNWPPFCFVENDRSVGIPSEWLPTRLLWEAEGIAPGPAMPYWNFEQLLPTWANKADDYIRERAAEDEPFFLYLASTSPHTPTAVNPEFMGKSWLNNRYADFVIETDDLFGRVLHSLDKHGVADDTLVIFASDNGCAPYVGTHDDPSNRFFKRGHAMEWMEPQGHYVSGPYRGYKSDAWDGGHRIPCIARWPGVIEPGGTCNQLVCLSDLMATCADFLGDELPPDAGEDSVSMMPLLRDPTARIRDHLVHHSIEGKFAVRQGRWKLVLCPGSGGWTKKDAEAVDEGLPMVQLYDMQADPGETHNLQAEHPEKVREMVILLKTFVDDGRSTPGPKQENDVPVDLWKLQTMPAAKPDMLDDV